MASGLAQGDLNHYGLPIRTYDYSQLERNADSPNSASDAAPET